MSKLNVAGHTLCAPLNVIFDGLLHKPAESLSAVTDCHLDVW